MYLLEREIFARVITCDGVPVVDLRKFNLISGRFVAQSIGIKLHLEEWERVLKARVEVLTLMDEAAESAAKDTEWFIETSGDFKIRVNLFHGRTYVHIRRFFEKDGEMRATKRGIALTKAGFNKLLEKEDYLKNDIAMMKAVL